MNKFFKFCVIVFGAMNVVFSMFLPVFIVLLTITVFDLSKINSIIMVVVGFGAALFRSIKYFIE